MGSKLKTFYFQLLIFILKMLVSWLIKSIMKVIVRGSFSLARGPEKSLSYFRRYNKVVK